MMTPTACITFSYELMFENGKKENIDLGFAYGAYEARTLLAKYGIKYSDATILNSTKPRTVVPTKLPYYDDIDTHDKVIAKLAKKYGWHTNPLVNVHLTFQRILK